MRILKVKTCCDESVEEAFNHHMWITGDGRTVVNSTLKAYEKGKKDGIKYMIDALRPLIKNKKMQKELDILLTPHTTG